MKSLAERKLILVKQIQQLDKQLSELKWQNYWWYELAPLGSAGDALTAMYVIAKPNSKG